MQKAIRILLILALLLAIFLGIYDFIKQREIEKEKEKENELVTVKRITFIGSEGRCPWIYERDYDNIKVRFLDNSVEIHFIYGKVPISIKDGKVEYQDKADSKYLVSLDNIIIEY